MSCSYPMVALPDSRSSKYGWNPVNMKYKFQGKLSDLGEWSDIKDKYPDAILLPCGNCRGCRLDQSRKWADRMCLEYDHTKKAVFLTLTYDDEHLPRSNLDIPTLVKSDMSDFMKNLRGNKYYDKREIRFYGSGEYGDKLQRPHMHIILFGLSLSDFSDSNVIRNFVRPESFNGLDDHELYYAGKNDLGQVYYRCPHLEHIIWKKGRICISEFSWNTAAYVARYVRKKLNGNLAEKYEDLGIQPPFALMSRRPGIAGYFIQDHPEKDFFEETKFSFNGNQRPIPDYIFDKLENIDRDSYFVYHAIKDQRKKYAEDRMLLKLQQTDLSFEELLSVEEHRLESVSTSLKRNLE